MKTLAMLKMEKNFIAVIEKKYSRKPYEAFSTRFLVKRLNDELVELINAINEERIQGAKDECADISNLVDYIFERLSTGQIR